MQVLPVIVIRFAPFHCQQILLAGDDNLVRCKTGDGDGDPVSVRTGANDIVGRIATLIFR